jgi:hypothetical protein
MRKSGVRRGGLKLRRIGGKTKSFFCKHILNIGCTLQPNFADGCLTIEIINVLSASENPEIKRGLRFLFVHEDGVLVDTD